MAYHKHTGFYYSHNFLPICVMIMAAVAIFLALI